VQTQLINYYCPGVKPAGQRVGHGGGLAVKRGFVFYVVLFLALLPAAYGATITEIDIYTCATNSSVYPLISGS
jgi:hypothetical protein